MMLSKRFSHRLDYHQLPAYAKVMDGIGWDSIPVSGSYLFVKRIGPLAFAKLQRPSNAELKRLVSLQQKLKIVQLFLEPSLEMKINGKFYQEAKTQELLSAAGFVPTSNHHAYTKTFVFDISGALASVIKSFSKTMQYQMRKSQQLGVEYINIPFWQLTRQDKLEIFNLHEAWSKERKVLGYPNNFLEALWQGFGERGEMILARKEGVLHGALFLLSNGPVGLYFYQFSSKSARDELYIPSGLAYQGVVRAKELGCTIFDLCSCFDERYPSENLKWQGFSEHKLRFHPTPIYYPSAFVRQIKVNL